ncbi:MAG: S-layer homology domain-containing protein [Bacillota bacterium]|nr:S-layer homology domain-containing protein [Bacillota bacterium]
MTDNLGTVSIVWSSSTPNVIANDGTITRPAESTQVTLTATLTAGTETDAISIPVTVTPPSSADADASKIAALMDGIASGYTDTYNNSKVIIDMAAYEDFKPTTTHKLSADAKQKYVNFVASSVTDSSAGDTIFALSMISLQGLGYDPQQLYPVNSNTALNIVTKLNGATHSESAWNAPYTLAAYNQGSYDTDSYEQALITKILAKQKSNGSWTEWGDSIQTTSNMIVGLSFYRDQETVKAAINKAVTYLSNQQKANGTFDAYGSGPDTDACANVVMALATVGINPDTDQRFIKNGNSALDGLLLFALEDNSGFGYQDNITLNPYATEEGFRALIAAAQVMSTGEPYNIYDFSANPVTPARETSNSSSDKPTTPPTAPDNDITVTVTIKADTGYWLRSKSVTVSEGSTVCDAFVTALEGTGITQVGAETGYIRSITKNGVTLAEFTQGPNSGWLYKVNGELPTVGVTTCTLNAGDSVVLYYTEDWTKDPSAGGNSGTVTPAPSTPASSLTPEVSANSKGEATVKVDANAVEDSLAQAEKENASALVIAPKVTGQVDTVTTQLPLSAAETISQDSDLDLTVQTEDAAVTIPNEALGSIVTQSSGSQTIEIVVKTCDPDTLKDQAAGLDLENAAAVEVTVLSGGSPITTFGGQTLAIDLPVDKTVYTEGTQYKVLVLSADGTVETLTGQCIREQGRLVVRVFTSHLSTFLVTTQTVLPFTDVDGHWALDAIRFVYDQGLMTGTKETLFSPNSPLNRAMLATILYRMEGSPAVTGENPYTDVAAGTWYTDAVLWASEQGIVNGYGNGKFGPLNNITREQLAAMLLRYSDYKKYNTDTRNDLASYADADDISAWALEALRWANAQGLVTGRTETTLVPQGDTTRAETATILMRYLDTIAG